MSSGLILPKGKTIGNFEIIERVASVISVSGRPYGTYSVRCLKCGNNVILATYQMHQRKDCGCTKQSYFNTISQRMVKVPPKPTAWMTDGEIYREWKQSKDKRQAFKILAQLNDVPIQSIIDIVKKQEENNEQTGTT